MLGTLLSSLLWPVPALPQDVHVPDLLELKTFEDSLGKEAVRGVYRVRENRELESGPWLELDLVVLLATGDDPAPDPIFILHGGPGGAASTLWRGYTDSWMRERRDIVFVDQRGTGGNHALRCPLDEEDPQAYLSPGFAEDFFRDCMGRLSERFDLTQYTTPIAAHDLYEVSAALGYDKVNLIGGSYGTRMALVTMREHPEMVRTAVLDGVAPLSFTNPLFHASSAQECWDKIVAECALSPARVEAFGDLDAKLQAVLERLADKPAKVEVRVQGKSEKVTVHLTRDAFAEALRTLMYFTAGNRQVPLAVCDAYEGDYTLFAERGMAVSRGIRRSLAMGMLLSVTCPEDVARIDPESIPRWTAETFLGDLRVRRQMAICEFWPKGDVGEDYGRPVKADIPTLLLSGSHDPVTPPRFGAEAARHLPNSIHVVVPGCHGVQGTGCVPQILRDFLESGSVEGLDVECVERMSMPLFTVR